MGNLLQPNYQFLSSGEKAILYTISLLPEKMYSANYIFKVFGLNHDSKEGVEFFDTLHGLTAKGWLNFSKGNYQLNGVKKKLLYSFRLPDFHYFRRLAKNVTNFFSRYNNIEKIPAEVLENQEQVAVNILDNILRPTKQIAVLARNLSNYYKRKKAVYQAFKYSALAVEMQKELDDKDDDLCCCLAERASLLYSMKKYKEAIIDALHCLTLCMEGDSMKKYCSRQLSLGILAASYEKTGNYDLSFKYALNALKLGRELKLSATLQQWLSYYNAGISFFRNRKFSDAWLCIVKAYAEFCDEKSKKPAFFSKLNFRRIFYEFVYRFCRLFLK